MSTHELNEQKFQNAILYILQRAPSPPGVTVLLKTLYFSDSEHYRKYLSPITGAPYVALENGPVVDNYKQRLAALVDQGILEGRNVPSGGMRPKIEYWPLQDPDMSLFTETELAVLDAVIEECATETGSALSHRTHREGPWAFVWDPKDPGREIPYLLFRWADNLPDEYDLEMAREQLAQMNVTAAIATARPA